MTAIPSSSLEPPVDRPMLFPPLANIATYRECGLPGRSVEQTVALLRRLLYIEGQSTRIFTAHLNAVPEWEAKCAMSLHLWQDAEHCTWLRQRVTEMRNPPVRLDQIPSEGLKIFFQELIRSRTTAELLTGIYGVLKPAVVAAMQDHVASANPLADYPTLRLFEFILLEEKRQLEWGNAALRVIEAAVGGGDGLAAWKANLLHCLRAAGDATGPDPDAPPGPAPERRDQSFEPERTPQRDIRFLNVWNSRGLGPAGESVTAVERDLHQLYIRLTEMHVPELIALIMHDWKDQPWEFYHALARHLFDETRHAMMGEAAFELRGLDWKTVPHEISFAEAPNRIMSPRDRYTLLWGIEHSLMAKEGGKRSEFEIAMAAGDALATTFQDFDWADEVLHVQIANRWLKPAFPSDEAMQTTYRRVKQELDSVVNQDLSLPRSRWWEEFYRRSCRA